MHKQKLPETVSRTINFVRLLVTLEKREGACALFVQKPPDKTKQDETKKNKQKKKELFVGAEREENLIRKDPDKSELSIHIRFLNQA